MRTVGLIGGMSWLSSRIYYERINQAVTERLGGAHSAQLMLNSLDFGPLAAMQAEGRWREAGAALANAAEALERAGVDAIAICANTMHRVAEQVKAAVRLPLLHIGEPLAKALRRDARSRPLLLGTRYTMDDPFLADYLAARGIGVVTPEKADREAMHAIIHDELVRGVVSQQALNVVRGIIARAATREADSIIFGCTEIGLLLPASEAGAPAYDTLELHAEAIVAFMLGDAPSR